MGQLKKATFSCQMVGLFHDIAELFLLVAYRVVKHNLQVVKLVDSEHVNKDMVQNLSPKWKHNLFTLIQSKKCLLSAQASENLQKGSGSQDCLVPI